MKIEGKRSLITGGSNGPSTSMRCDGFFPIDSGRILLDRVGLAHKANVLAFGAVCRPAAARGDRARTESCALSATS
jgi:hypothetical protein